MIEWYLVVLKKYAEFNGRARRSEYWYFFLCNVIISFGLAFLGGMIGINDTLSNVYSIGVLIPSIAVGIRRMHDVDKSGWFILIPIYNLVLACTEGTPGPNEYGPDPKSDSEPEGM